MARGNDSRLRILDASETVRLAETGRKFAHANGHSFT